jgi:thiamine-phosphate pyrophosphorylase
MQATATDVAGTRRRARAARLFGLYAVTPDIADTASLVAAVGAAISGGAAAVQYRNKTAEPGVRRTQAAALARVHATRGALYIVNDDAALAAEMDADGVHIGSDDGDIATARAIVGPDRIIGASCYDDYARAEAAVAAGADYVAFGSFHASAMKPAARRANVTLLERARALRVPVVAIGGIDVANAPVLRVAGADAIAVISALFGAPDIESAARAFARVFEPL